MPFQNLFSFSFRNPCIFEISLCTLRIATLPQIKANNHHKTTSQKPTHLQYQLYANPNQVQKPTQNNVSKTNTLGMATLCQTKSKTSTKPRLKTKVSSRPKSKNLNQSSENTNHKIKVSSRPEDENLNQSSENTNRKTKVFSRLELENLNQSSKNINHKTKVSFRPEPKNLNQCLKTTSQTHASSTKTCRVTQATSDQPANKQLSKRTARPRQDHPM